MAEKEKVVLLLGEIGSGKTTFINSLFNYVKHDEMNTKDVELPIGIHLSLTHPDTFNIQTVPLGPNEDLDNEIDEIGHSSTQDVRVYKLQHDNCKYVIIDTPGLGDCEGIKRDKTSMKKIINTLALYNDIINVCIVIDANCSNKSLEYFFQTIFTYFNNRTFYNFFLCFTKTRRTSYSPGDNFSFIRKTLPTAIQNMLDTKSIFCVDNEGMKHVATMSCSSIDDVHKRYLENFDREARESWRKSAIEAKRLLTTVAHQEQNTTDSLIVSNSQMENRRILKASSCGSETQLKDHINKLIVKINAYKAEKAELETKIGNYHQENKTLKDNNQLLKVELTNMRTRLEGSILAEKQQNRKLEEKMEETQELLKKEWVESITRYNKLEDRSKQERAQFEQEKRHLREEKERQKQSSEEQLEDMGNQWKASEEQHVEVQKRLQSDIYSLSSSLQDLKTDLSNKSADFERILSEKRETIRKLRDDNQRFLTNVRKQMDITSVFNKNMHSATDIIRDLLLLDSNTYNEPIDREKVLPEKIKKSKFSKDEKIILLLGEKGVGKSTFINCALNYISHPDIYEAMTHEAKILIPTHVDIYDDQYTRRNSKLFKHNIDSNVVYDEKVSKGQSLTQRARYYRINDGEHKYVLIDTAGIGDIRGEDKDKECLNELKKFLRDEGITHIHAVCILMHPNYKRFTDSMIYALDSTIDFFGPQAYNNIFFCFTRTASTSFKPGDTLSTLRNYLKERATKAGRYLKADTSNVFCFENSCFREKLVYEMDNVRVPDQRAVEAWNKSVDSMNKLFQAIYRHEKLFDIPESWFESR